jgi:hypothetical protein
MCVVNETDATSSSAGRLAVPFPCQDLKNSMGFCRGTSNQLGHTRFHRLRMPTAFRMRDSGILGTEILIVGYLSPLSLYVPAT